MLVMKNIMDGIKNRSYIIEEKINEIKNRKIKTIQNEKQNES